MWGPLSLSHMECTARKRWGETRVPVSSLQKSAMPDDGLGIRAFSMRMGGRGGGKVPTCPLKGTSQGNSSNPHACDALLTYDVTCEETVRKWS